MNKVIELTAGELLTGYARRDFSPVEVIDAHAAQIERIEPQLKAFVALTLDRAREEAHQAEDAWQRGTARPLEGVPFAAKDLYDTARIPTAYGSPIFRDHVPTADAEAVRRAREAGAILVGKTSTHEFAWGITSYNAHFDAGRNPWRAARVSGGSSGGSAAALAALEVPLALGSDTGGSIRIPAAFCGVCGLKPTYGTVDGRGLYPLAPSLDHAGVLARTPSDAALLLAQLAGVDVSPPRASLERTDIAVSRDLMPVALADDVAAVFDSALATLEAEGARLVEVELPEARDAVACFRALQGFEALRVHRRAGLWPARRDDYGADVRLRLEATEAITADDFVEATLAREQLRGGFARLFRTAELIVTPVAAASPPPLGDDETEHLGAMKPFRDVVLPYTVPQDLAGLPACVVRAGFDRFGIPVGMQLTGPPGHEAAVVGSAQAFFDATRELQERRPEIS